MSSKSVNKFLRRIDVRLTFYYAVCVLLLSGITCAFLYHRLARRLSKQVSDTLLATSCEIAGMFDPAKPNHMRLADELELEARTTRLYKLSGRILSARGEVLAQTQYFFDSSHPTDTATFRQALGGREVVESVRVQGRRHLYRVCTAPVRANGRTAYVLQLGIYMDSVNKDLSHFLQNVLLALPALFVLSVGMGGFLARRSLAPVGQMSATARHMTASRLNERVPQPGTGDELDELAKTLNLMLERLENAFEHMARFSADVSHELRTPVATLRTGAEVMLSGTHSPHEYQDFCERSLAQCDRLSRIINDLLLLHRLDADANALPTKAVTLNGIIGEVYPMFEEAATYKGVAMDYQAAPDVVVQGNPEMLRRLFSNLLDNAVKYTGEAGSVDVVLSRQAQGAIVTVRDTGIGIGAEDLPHVFETFWRADPSRSRETGSAGLGLSICRSIAEVHGGSISAHSELGRGTCLTVTIPAS